MAAIDILGDFGLVRPDDDLAAGAPGDQGERGAPRARADNAEAFHGTEFALAAPPSASDLPLSRASGRGRGPRAARR